MACFQRFYLTREARACFKSGDYVVDFLAELPTSLQAITYTGFATSIGASGNNGCTQGGTEGNNERMIGESNSNGCILSP